jgi:hypothetical protein
MHLTTVQSVLLSIPHKEVEEETIDFDSAIVSGCSDGDNRQIDILYWINETIKGKSCQYRFEVFL